MKTIRQNIISDEEVKAVNDELLELPDQIKNAKKALREAEMTLATANSIKEVKDSLAEYEAEVAFEVAMEVDDSGKKVYSNDKLRSSATAQKLAKDEKYLGIKEQIKEFEQSRLKAEFNVSKAKDELNYHMNCFQAAIAQTYMIAGLSQENDPTRTAEESFNSIKRWIHDVSK